MNKQQYNKAYSAAREERRFWNDGTNGNHEMVGFYAAMEFRADENPGDPIPAIFITHDPLKDKAFDKQQAEAKGELYCYAARIRDDHRYYAAFDQEQL